jgi:hypothetical protein
MEPTHDPDLAPKRRVKFGPRPTQNMAFEWAEAMLTAWAERQPHEFGRYLQLAALGELPPAARKTRGSDVQ